MTNGWIDLRSDTVTLPTPAMRQAIADAELGDDVFGEDPTVRRLEEAVAQRLGKEAALFVPSGTMSNQIGVRLHTQSGDELICEQESHLFVYEGGGPAVLSGVTCRTVRGRRGVLDLPDVENLLRPDDIHQPRSRLLCLENTHNRGGGALYPQENIDRLCDWAHAHGLATHLDGARLFNAVVATGVVADRLVRGFDTVSVCFSKGLGAPVGSALVGSKDHIRAALRIRKLLGGGMRQAGLLAGGALYALEHHVERLAEDHANAQLIAKAAEKSGLFDLSAGTVQTNLIWAPLAANAGTAAELVEELRRRKILALALGPRLVRFCTHLDVSQSQAHRVAETLLELGANRKG
jgi:threonine aldolase